MVKDRFGLFSAGKAYFCRDYSALYKTSKTA